MVKWRRVGEQIEVAAAEEHHQQKALVGIKMSKLNHLINKPLTNGLSMLKYSMLKMYYTLNL